MSFDRCDVIWESKPWKDDLGRTAEFLEESSSSSVIDDEQVQMRIEKAIMGAAYAMRKLRDAEKLSESVLGTQVHARRFPSTPKHVDLMNWHNPREQYDFDRGRNHTFSLGQFCNEVIHSWVFVIEHDENGSLAGILLSSDKHRNKCLFRIELDEVLKLIRKVAADWPDGARMRRDPETNDWESVNFYQPDEES